LCSRYYYLLSVVYACGTWGMMREETLAPQAGELVLREELPAAIYGLLCEEEYKNFAMRRHTYCIDDRERIMALQGGAASAVKIFEHHNGFLTEIQEIRDSFYPVLDPQGSGLAVIRKEGEKACFLEYYKRLLNGTFESKTKLVFEHIIRTMMFNKDGSQLTVCFTCVQAQKKSEDKEFLQNSAGQLEPVKKTKLTKIKQFFLDIQDDSGDDD
jgi:hypothetical protein